MDGVLAGLPEPALLERARRFGPLPWSATGLVGKAGPPEGPPAQWIAESIDRWWRDLGRPDPFTVVELGAGDGSRARDVLALGPESLSALRYVAVESGDSGARFRLHAGNLPVEDPAFLFPVSLPDPDDPDETAPPATGVGPLVTSLGDLPVVPGPAFVVAVSWLCRLPSDRVQWGEGRWWEVRVAARHDSETLVEVLVPLEPRRVELVRELLRGRHLEDGLRFALLVGAVAWMSEGLGAAPSGGLAVVDRWTTRTDPLADDGPPALCLDQMARHRDPIDFQPEVASGDLSVVSWRLG
jgi:hypothetical protein